MTKFTAMLAATLVVMTGLAIWVENLFLACITIIGATASLYIGYKYRNTDSGRE